MKKKASSAVLATNGETPTVRERTVAHMMNLLRNTTKIGAGLALAWGISCQGNKRPVPVDPLPPPAPPGLCEDPKTLDLHHNVFPYAEWRKSGERWTIFLNVSVDMCVDRMNFDGLTRENIWISGASLNSLALGHDIIQLFLTPLKENNKVEINFEVRRNQQVVPFRLTLDLRKPPEDHAWIPGELVDE